MSDVVVWIFAALLTYLVMYEIGHVQGSNAMQDQLQTQAIEHGYALYCPTDDSVQHKGKFAWNGECDK